MTYVVLIEQLSISGCCIHKTFQEILLVLVFVFDVSMTPGIPGATAFQIKELSLKTEY